MSIRRRFGGLGLGMGLGGGSGVVNPLLDLINKYGVPGLIFDNTELYTDAAGTLVAGVGDVVGNAADLSGGSHDITQSTTAEKPILRAGPLLEFDGTDDWLGTSNPFTGDEITIIWCGKFRTAPTGKYFISIGDSADTTKYIALVGNTAISFRFEAIGVIGGTSFNAAVPNLTDTFIGSFRSNTTTGELSHNQSRTVQGAFTALDLTQVDLFTIGVLRRNPPFGYSDIDQDYAFVINKYLTTAELAQAEQYIAGLCGVTL